MFKQKTADEMRISDWSSDVCSSDLHRLNIHHLKRRAAPAGCARKPARAARLRVPARGGEGLHIFDLAARFEFYAKAFADLGEAAHAAVGGVEDRPVRGRGLGHHRCAGLVDRKSTRLNSSH